MKNGRNKAGKINFGNSGLSPIANAKKDADRERHIKEAASVGLDLIGECGRKGYRLYKYQKCGHVAELRPHRVKIKKFLCHECKNKTISQKNIDEAQRVGLTPVKKHSKAAYIVYRFNACGHEQAISTSAVRDNRFRCNKCPIPFTKKNLNEAKKAGLRIVARSVQKNRSDLFIYEFIKCGHVAEISNGQVRNRIFRCNQCLNEKHQKEAFEKGFTLLGEGTKPTNRKYKCNKCGTISIKNPTALRRTKEHSCEICAEKVFHEEAKLAGLKMLLGSNKDKRLYECKKCNERLRLSTRTVRNHGFRCKSCRIKELKTIADRQGLILLETHPITGRGHYRFKNCNHSYSMGHGAVKSGQFRCRMCFTENLILDAEKVGLHYIQKVKNRSGYYLFKFNKCGHNQEISGRRVRQNNFECKQCIQEKLQREATLVGLTLIGPAKNSRYRNYKFDGCGHEQEIKTGAVRVGGFLCRKCEETSRLKPSKIYLVELSKQDFHWLKLGYSNNISERLKRYGLGTDISARILTSIDVETGEKAHFYENKIHKKYRKKKLKSKEMENFHTVSGATECYPIEMIDILSGEIEYISKNMKGSRNS